LVVGGAGVGGVHTPVKRLTGGGFLSSIGPPAASD
jgi:hypothetical protein